LRLAVEKSIMNDVPRHFVGELSVGWDFYHAAIIEVHAKGID